MNKTLFTILIIIVLLPSSIYAQEGANIQLVKSNITPQPVEPGEDMVLSFSIINNGEDTARNINIKNLNKNSAFIYKDDTHTKENFSLCGGCSHQTTYYFTLNHNTTSGTYSVNFEISYNNGIVKEETILVPVRGKPELVITEDTLEKKKLAPGKPFLVNFSIENIGTSLAKDIKLSIDSDKIVNKGGQTKILDNIDPSSKKSQVINLTSSPSLSPGVYTLPIKLNYHGIMGEEFASDYKLGLVIEDKANLSFQNIKIDSTTITPYKDIAIQGMIENSGVGEAENVYLEIKGEEFDGYKKAFIGSLDKNEDSPFFFQLKSESPGEHQLEVILHYNDDFGSHIKKENINIDVEKPGKQLLLIGLVGTILIVVVSYIFIRKRRK